MTVKISPTKLIAAQDRIVQRIINLNATTDCVFPRNGIVTVMKTVETALMNSTAPERESQKKKKKNSAHFI